MSALANGVLALTSLVLEDATARLEAKNRRIAELEANARDDLSVMLWLLRRLPRAYENPPHVVEPIRRLARLTGIDVEDVLAERRAVPAHPGEGENERK